MHDNRSTSNAVLLRQGYDLALQQRDAFSNLYYARLFQLYPQLELFFARSSERERQGSLLGTLLSIVALAENSRHFEMAIRVFGLRHERLGVLPEHYPMVKRALLETLQQFLEETWSPQVALAWEEGFEHAVAYMLE